jgi:hypothetical protein
VQSPRAHWEKRVWGSRAGGPWHGPLGLQPSRVPNARRPASQVRGPQVSGRERSPVAGTGGATRSYGSGGVTCGPGSPRSSPAGFASPPSCAGRLTLGRWACAPRMRVAPGVTSRRETKHSTPRRQLRRRHHPAPKGTGAETPSPAPACQRRRGHSPACHAPLPPGARVPAP